MRKMVERKLSAAVVTGPTGALGTALCEKLLREGLTVCAVCRPGSPRISALPKDRSLFTVECDASGYDALPDKVKKADVFFHLAWAHTIGPGRNDMPAQIDNIRYTIDAVRAAAEMGCRVFVGAGSQAEYGRVTGMLEPDTPAFPENGYGMAKLCAGQMSRLECRKLGLDHIWPRILSLYGPHDGPATMITSAIRALLAGQRPSFTAGEQKWDYLYSGDAADAFFRMAKHGRDGAVYPLGSGEARPLKEYIRELRDAVDPELPVGLGDIPYGPNQVMYLKADIRSLSEDTGFLPKTGFAEGIRKTIQWMKEENHG
jgi:nucleoside-diphosphate-sugar epimerase